MILPNLMGSPLVNVAAAVQSWGGKALTTMFDMRQSFTAIVAGESMLLLPSCLLMQVHGP